MSSAALLSLRANIAANTLTAGEQGALLTALDAIIPTFPTIDERANALPPPDEDDSREWIAALYAIQEGSAVVPPPTDVTSVTGTFPIVVAPATPDPVVSISAPSRGYNFNAAPQVLSGAVIDLAAVTLTPLISGRLRVRITGVVQNNDSSATQHPVILSVNAGGAALQTQDTYRSTAAEAANSTIGIGLVVDLDQAQTPTVFPLGTPVTINAGLQGDGTGHLSVAAAGLQIEVEEGLAP